MINAKILSMRALFNNRKTIQDEMDDRAWKYLEKIGIDAYKKTNMYVSIETKNRIEIIHVEAQFEFNFKYESITLDIPYTHFEMIVPAEVESFSGPGVEDI